MKPVSLEHGWLRLRPFTSADISWVYEVSIDREVRHFTGVPSPYRPSDARYFVEEVAIGGWASGQRTEFLAEETATGRRLGRVGLGMRDGGRASLGYWTDPAARRRGVATEGARAVCTWAFAALGLAVIDWECEVGNEASRRVARNVGFVMTGTAPARLVHRGIKVDAWTGYLTSDLLVSGRAGSSGSSTS